MSSISSVASSSSSSYIFELNQAKAQQRKQNWDDLSEALESGDLDAAKTAFTKIQSSMPAKAESSGDSGSTTGDGQSGSSNPMAEDFQALSDALESGDLDAAKSAFEKIQTNMKSHRPPPPPDEASSTDETDETDSSSYTLKLINSTDASDETDSTSSTSSSSSTTAETVLSQLIAYLSNGQATTDSQTGSQYKAQA